MEQWLETHGFVHIGQVASSTAGVKQEIFLKGGKDPTVNFVT